MKSKLARVVLIALFLASLYVPTLLWLTAGDKLAVENHENRTLAAWPDLKETSISKLPGKIESYYADHLPFRSQLIAGYARLLRPLDASVVTTVGFGKDGWMFYTNPKDGDPIGSYRGEDLFSMAELRQIVVDLRRTRDNLKKQGIDFVLFIVPNKERVYSEYMADRYGEPAESYGTKQLVDFLRAHTDLKVVYAYEELMAAKEEFPDLPLYYKTDTHWNGLGAYVGARALLRETGIELPAPTRDTITLIDYSQRGDLSILSHLEDAVEGDPTFNVEDAARPAYTLETGEDLMRHMGTGQSSGKKLYIKTDSFAGGMLPYIVPWFSETKSYFNELYEDEMVDEMQPDVFVQVCVERYVEKWLTRGPLYTLPQDRQ